MALHTTDRSEALAGITSNTPNQGQPSFNDDNATSHKRKLIMYSPRPTEVRPLRSDAGVQKRETYRSL
jgi:hypothetical protein